MQLCMLFLYWFINCSRFEHQSDFHLGYDTECSWEKKVKPTLTFIWMFCIQTNTYL